jgi:hypothetical protein
MKFGERMFKAAWTNTGQVVRPAEVKAALINVSKTSYMNMP